MSSSSCHGIVQCAKTSPRGRWAICSIMLLADRHAVSHPLTNLKHGYPGCRESCAECVAVAIPHYSPLTADSSPSLSALKNTINCVYIKGAAILVAKDVIRVCMPWNPFQYGLKAVADSVHGDCALLASLAARLNQASSPVNIRVSQDYNFSSPHTRVDCPLYDVPEPAGSNLF